MLLIIGPHKDTYKWQFLKISNMQHFKNEFSEVHTKLKPGLHCKVPYDVTMLVNKQGDDITITIFLARLILFAVWGPQVYALLYSKMLKCPTFFEKPW